jgi:hypothetical protein
VMLCFVDVQGKRDSLWLEKNALYIYIYELQPKFRVMESSIRDIFIFWKLIWGLENDNTLFKNWWLGAI